MKKTFKKTIVFLTIAVILISSISLITVTCKHNKTENESITDNNPLYGKSVIFAGDSICTGNTANDKLNGWAGRIGNKNNMTWENKSVAGYTITEGIKNDCICNTDFGDAPDYIILEGGVNDADCIGLALETKPKKFGTYTPDNFTGPFDKTTFCGAVEALFQRLKNDYPNSKIGFIIAQKQGDVGGNYYNNRRYYFDTLIKLCEKWKIPYIDLWNDCELNPGNPSHYSPINKIYYTDNQHLTSAGYEYITPLIEEWMKSL